MNPFAFPEDNPPDCPHEEDLSWLNSRPSNDLTTTQPAQLLRGILYQKCKLVLMGGSKSFKTWTLMDMAFCVANGLLWWGVHTLQCPVVYLDWELLDYDFRWRMDQIAQAYGKGSIELVRRVGLRGRTLSPGHWTCLYENLARDKAGLICADPTYKLVGPQRDENLARDIAQVTTMLDSLSEKSGAAIAYALHFSKGNQAQKDSIDRGAGSGVWARDADAIITMTKHESDDCLTVEHTLRSFPRIDPFVVRWNCPLFTREPDLDPQALKQPGHLKTLTYTVSDLVSCLNGCDLSTNEFKKTFMNETGASKATFFRLLKAAEASNLVHKSHIDNRWEKIQRSVSNA